MTSGSEHKRDLVVGWKVNQGFDPEYWMRPDASPGKHEGADLVTVRPSSIAQHTAVIAQSGSGKSFFLGRLLEEIALKTQARLVVFDPNSDFRRLRDTVPQNSWQSTHSNYNHRKRRGWLSDEVSAEEFLGAWSKVPIAVHSARAKKAGSVYPLKLWWPSIPVDFLQEDVHQIGRNDMYHCHAFVRTVASLISQSGRQDSDDLLMKAKELLLLARQVGAPEAFRKHLDTVYPDTATPNDQLARTASKSLLTRFSLLGLELFARLPNLESSRSRLKAALVNASAYVAPEIERFYFGRAYRTNDSGILNLGLQEGDSYTGNSAARVEVIDLPSIKDRSVQILSASTVLEVEWNNARQRWADALEKPHDEDTRFPTLIVVDEAHNLMPSETRGSGEASLREQFRRIAAEGRKFGLFLVLVSQRPDKLDPLVLSECENKLLMRLGSASVLGIAKRLLGLEEVPDKILNKCLEFDQGRGLLLGEWVEGTPTYFYGAARRTVEGGRNLRPEAWAHSQPAKPPEKPLAVQSSTSTPAPAPSAPEAEAPKVGPKRGTRIRRPANPGDAGAPPAPPPSSKRKRR